MTRPKTHFGKSEKTHEKNKPKLNAKSNNNPLNPQYRGIMSTTTAVDGEERVMATAQQIVKSLNTTKDATQDMLLILSNFDNRLSNISDLLSDQSQSHPTLSSFQDAENLLQSPNYLCAVDDIIRLSDLIDLRTDGPQVIDRAESSIQISMSLLEDKFRSILTLNRIHLHPDQIHLSSRRVSLSFASRADDIDALESFVDEDRHGCFHERAPTLSPEFQYDLVRPEAVFELKQIADRMVRSGYEKECCQVYTDVRREALRDSVSLLGLDILSIEEVQKIDWKMLDEKMKSWVRAIKVLVRVLLHGEKKICDEIFGPSDLIKEVCFAETTKGFVTQVLNFGEAVAIGRRSPEKLFGILDMYDSLTSVVVELRGMFSAECGDYIHSEAKGVLSGLGEAAKGTFLEFENAVRDEPSKKPMQAGEIHPLTRYVMNYVKLLVEYTETLNSLLDGTDDGLDGLSGNENDSATPIGRQLTSVLSHLESNLERKSKLYEDNALKYVFLMNNILYIVQRVKDTELGKILGDRWVRKHRGQVRQHSTSYLRASWSKVLSCLKDEGVGGSSSNASRVALKERFKSFNASFEDVYRIQTAWKVPDSQLREELRISISEKVIPAYRAFLGRFGHQIENGRHSGKYIKFTPEDLEGYLLHFFEGTPCLMHHLRRRSG